jgi:PAS domain S-box-containing protein
MESPKRHRVKEELRTEKERFQMLSEHAPFGMVMIDKDGTFKYINPKFRELFGYELNDIPNGKTWFRKAYPDPTCRHNVISPWINDLKIFTLGEKRPRVFTLTCKNGSKKVINFIPVQLETGENLMTCEDITERMYTEEALRKSEGEAKQLAQENAIMAEIGQIISSTLNIEEIYERFAEGVNKLIPFDRIAINIINPKDQTVIIAYVTGVEIEGRQTGDTIPLSGTVTEEILRTRSSLLIQTNGRKDLARRFPGLLPSIQAKFKSLLSVPLFSKDQVIGVLHIRSIQSNAYSERELKLAERVGHQIAGAIANAQLFAERKQAEEALRGSEEKYRTILKNIEDSYYEVDIAGNFTFFNDSVCRMLGYTKDELMGMNDRQYTDKESAKKLFKAYNRVYRTGEPTKGFDWEIIRKDGTKRFIEASVSLIRDPRGKPIGFRGIARDITERKQMEQALQTERQRFQTLSEHAPFGMVMIGKDGTFRYINPKFRELFGYDLADVPDGKTWFRKAYPDPTYRHNAISTWINDLKIFALGERRPRVFTITCKDGTEKIVNIISVQLETGENLITCEDITEHIRFEETLRESEERYRTLFEGSRDSVYITIREGKFIDFNQAFLDLFGYSREELMVWQAQDFYVHPGDRYRFQQEIEKKGFVRDYEVKLRKKDGKEIDCLLTASVRRGYDGTIMGYQGIIRDITERKLIEEALRDSEARYRAIFENTGTGMLIIGEDTTVSLANAETEKILGYSIDEIKGKSWTEFIVKEDLERMMEYHHMRRIDPTAVPKNYESRLINSKGEMRDMFLTVSMIPKTNKTVASLLDITDRKRAEQEMKALEEQLRQSQKMEAIGRLAGGIAHDFNNILTIIKGYSQLSLSELKEGHPLRENLEGIKKSTDRATDLIRKILAFSRRQVMEMKVLDLNTLLMDLDKLLHRVIGEDIELVAVLAEDLGRVKVDPGQIEQVILNMAVNAKDAMLNGGKLTIETANTELDEAYARNHLAVAPGRYVMLSVSDTGVGMSPEVKERIFEPFYTTKEKGKGTGLGLSTVYGIVKQSGGNIWVYSELGQGTTFKIYLPREEEPLEEIREKVVNGELPLGSETVLVAEDEEEVRKLVVRILEKQGYKVLEASQGEEALFISKKHEEPIHLLVTDVVMPGMSGRDLSERLTSLRPEIKILYMSGHSDSAIIHHGVLERGVNLLQKPFTPEALARKVREVLER